MRYVKNSGGYRKRSRRSRARRRVAFTGLIAAALVFLAAVLTRPHAHAERVAAAPPPAASARPAAVRTPPPAWTPSQIADLRRAVENALGPAIAGARTWSLLVETHDGQALYENGAGRAVTPASVLKLIVSDAALTQLGPQYRYDTLLAASALPQNGTLDGDLFVVTSGDPSLRSTDLQRGIDELRARGLRAVNGSVVVDGSALAGDEINALWNADDANEDFMAATSGASIDEDTVEFRVTGTQDGAPARVDLVPASAPVKYSGAVDTGGGDDVTVGGTDAPNEFRLSGSIPAGAQEKYWLPVHGIPQYLAAIAAGTLKRDGITQTQAPRTGTVPVDAQILWEHRSQPLLQLLHHMLVFSDNHFAEQVMRTLGAAAGDAGNDANGIAEETAVLRTQAISTAGLHLVDGSGLAHANRVSARTLGGILVHFDQGPGGNELLGLLPRGGKDGTLKRYRFDAAAGRVRAKSGHLSDAASLAGYVETRRHGRLAFAFMINGSPGDPDDAIVDAVDALAQR